MIYTDGHSTTGGATVTEPEHGFADDKLQAIFATRNSRKTSTDPPSSSSTSTSLPTSTGLDPESSGLEGGAVAGVVVGVVAGVAVIVGMAFVLVRFRRKRNTGAMGELPAEHSPQDPTKPAGVPLAEAPGSPKVIYEMDGSTAVHELMDERGHKPVEIDDNKRDMEGVESRSWSVLDHRS